MSYSDPRTVCAPWVEPDALCCEGDGTPIESCDPDGEPTEQVFLWSDDALVLAASNILYARTCYRYPGLCEVTVWPCVACRCQRHPCSCGTWSAIELPTDYPLISVEEVRIDGDVVDPEAYRIDQSKYLVRIDGERWPTCNSFGISDEIVEVQVDMTVGREPPQELQMAAAALACELKQACNGSDTCALPPHVRSIARRGVEIEINDITSLMGGGLFGIPIVDMAVKMHGNCGHHGSVYDPTTHFRGYGTSGPIVGS